MLCLFSFSAFAFTSTGISGKISFRFAGEENLALRQCRLLTAAVNDNFILEQQCGYNSTLPHNVYNYLHWRKDLVAFCTSFNLSCSEVLQVKLGNRPHLWAFHLDFNIYFLCPFISGLIVLFGMFKY